MLKDDISNVLNFQRRLLFAHSNNHRCNSRTHTSAVIWRTVDGHIVTDVFRSKKSSSALLVHEQKAPLKGCLSSHYSAACGDCKRKIYKNTGSVCKGIIQAIFAKLINVQIIYHFGPQGGHTCHQVVMSDGGSYGTGMM